MKTLNTLGAEIELVSVNKSEGEELFGYTILYKGERKSGWFNAPENASDKWLGVWALVKADFTDDDVLSCVMELIADRIKTPEDLTRLVFSA